MKPTWILTDDRWSPQEPQCKVCRQTPVIRSSKHLFLDLPKVVDPFDDPSGSAHLRPAPLGRRPMTSSEAPTLNILSPRFGPAAGGSAGELAGQVDRRRRLDGKRQADHSLVAEGRTQAPLHHQGPEVGDAGAARRLQGQGRS